MKQKTLFEKAWPYQDDVLALPVSDIDIASKWYCNFFGMTEIRRFNDPIPTVILERDGVKLGFAINGKDSSQDGAAILVTDIHHAKDQLEANGLEISDIRAEERDGERLQVFFVVAPDELCFYFHQFCHINDRFWLNAVTN